MNNISATTIWANLKDNRFAHNGKGKAIIMWIAFFLFYAATTAQDILPSDSGEFQLITAEWGIAHPPGYPLYTVTGALWSHLISLGTFPFRTNLFSAVLAASTLVFTFNAIVIWAEKGGLSRHSANIGGLAAVILLGAAGTFWAQATIANIRMPTLLFTAWGFYALPRYDQFSPVSTRDRVLHELALVIGLGTGHHPSLLFVVIGWVAYIVLCDAKLIWTPRRWYKVIVITICAWGIPQLYLLIRGLMPGVVLNPGNLSTWQGFWNHVLARGFRGDMFAYATKTDLLLRLPLLPSLFRFQFPTLCILIMTAGWLWSCKWQWKFAIACALSWFIHTFVTITYRAPQTIEYLMPAYIPMAIIFGVSIAALYAFSASRSKRKQTVIYTTIPVCILMLLLGRLVLSIPDFATLAVDNHIRARTEPLLNAAPDNSLILADWRWVTPLWAMQKIEDRAPAVRIHYVYPEESRPYDKVWLDRVENADTQPVFITHFYDWQDWNFVPVGGGYRLYQRPLMHMPDDLDYIEHQVNMGSVRLLGYRIVGVSQPGQTVEMQLVWQAAHPFDPPPSFTARVWGDEGNLLAAADRYLGTDIEVGEIRFTQLTLQLPLDRCPTKIQVTIGVYTIESSAFIDQGTESLSTMEMLCEFPSLPVVRILPGFITNQGPWIRGIDYEMRTLSTGVAYLHLTGPGSPVNVYAGSAIVSVPSLKIGENFTTLIPLDTLDTNIYFSRADGSIANLIGFPFPRPKQWERYTPYGSKMVLVSSNLIHREEQAVLNLHWLASQPLAEDFVVSARLRPADDSWELRHDMQPGLGAIPTLKWVNTNSRFLDPHPFNDLPAAPRYFDLTVYEPYRMTPLISPYGTLVSYLLP